MLEVELRAALQLQQFELHYQPLIDLRSEAVLGFEALVRWRHPERGLVSPLEFIPLAEEIGLIVPIGEWVLREACTEAAAWPDDIVIAVNVSPAQFAGKDFLPSIVRALSSAGLLARRLELEVTESILLQDSESNLSTLHRLRALGVRVAMDDFGTGYSSLSYLRRFPFDKIKLDRSFVRDMTSDHDCAAIIRAISDLARGLHMATTAEGVETQEQSERLQAEGFTQGQGYLFSRPLPPRGVDEFLRTHGHIAGMTPLQPLANAACASPRRAEETAGEEASGQMRGDRAVKRASR
jgi:EAL domain-containing protein (putative c-di-GMP-specific phosphodiesterase class I)